MRVKPAAQQMIITKKNIPYYIEFVGPSGVGKSILQKEVLRIREPDINWLTPEEFIKLENVTVNDEIFNSTFQEIIKSKINKVLAHDLTSTNHLKVLSFLYRNITSVALVHHYNKNYKVLFEEGLFHNFGDSLFDLHQTNYKEFDDIISNRAIVFCTAKPETIANQILERNRLFSILQPFHEFKNFSELVEYQKGYLREVDRHIGLLRQKKVPILQINTSDNLQKNAIKVNGFINNLGQEKT